MPLYPDAPRLIRANLEAARKGIKPRAVAIGALTEKQLAPINAIRKRRGWELLEAEVVFVGPHFWDGRSAQGYSIDDMVVQAENAMSEDSVFIPTQKMTIIRNPNRRDDGYGNRVNDEATFECSSKFPRPELLSVIPRGDRKRPTDKNKKGCAVAAPETNPKT